MPKKNQNVKATNQGSRLEHSWRKRLQRLNTYLTTLHRKEKRDGQKD
jgi:hypothetical protein